MPNFNSCTFIGHLAREPEVRYTQSGTAVTEGAIGVNYGWGDNKDSFFLNFTVWGKTGEKLAEWCRKGDAVLIQGELREDKWQDKQTGEEKKKWVLNVRDWTKIKETSKRGGSGEGAEGQRRKKPDPAPVSDDDMDGIPF